LAVYFYDKNNEEKLRNGQDKKTTEIFTFFYRTKFKLENYSGCWHGTDIETA